MRCSSVAALFAAMGVCILANGAETPKSLGDLTGPWRLFVDDRWVAAKENVVRAYHSFRKHEANPIVCADKPWEGRTVYVYGTVLPGEDGQGYRMWYHGWSDGEYRMLYATSRDGIVWEKPSLGLVEYRGTKETNLLFRRTHENHLPQVIHTPWEADAQRRYKMMYFEYGRTPPEYVVCGYRGAISPDGIHWTDVPKNPVLPDNPGDVGNFVWDAHEQRYLGWAKHFAEVRGARRRCVGWSATTDFEAWPPVELTLVPDEYDDRWATTEGQRTDFYGLSGFPYESMYLGFLWIFRITDGKDDGPIFVELVSSHDGVHWARQEAPRPPLLELGSEGSWDDGMVFTANQPLVEGGVVKLYYGGCDATHAVLTANSSIGLATLRKDGFVSLDARDADGTVETKPVAIGKGRLRVNFAASDNGMVRVEALDSDGNVIPGYGRDACVPLEGDSIDGGVTWRDRESLPRNAGSVRLRFLLENASLYSFLAE